MKTTKKLETMKTETNLDHETRIGEQISYLTKPVFGTGGMRYGFVIAIADKGDYKKILLDTGKTIYRAK